ncbi:hypothetical protein PCASD_11310 [Puccinia coronata f. sp. avenae]|uniref:Uncharacterized protein n=1 Tax=Puccinia coronata f. sp. avenae TaxID=200324 RepID=A0A2N5UJ99_9BASI|nr:hypothetical protein PCASD_11310 [Puccinia coronata f. sp. avenae]
MNPLGFTARTCLRTTIHHSSPKPFYLSRSQFHSTARQRLPDQPQATVDAPPKTIAPSTSGKKFKELAQDLHQRSLSLVELEAIQLPSNYTDQRARENDKSKASELNSVDTDTKSRRKRRTDFTPDPQFKFERKRGKKHIMLQLKQAKLNGGSAQSQKIELVDHLDLSLRWQGRLNQIIFSLPTSPSQFNSKSSSSSSSDTSFDQQPTPKKEEKLSGIDEFIKLCLGPLVWSNPKVDISLVYSPEQSKPSVTFWTTEEAEDGSIQNQKSNQVEIQGKSRSDILRLVLNQTK